MSSQQLERLHFVVASDSAVLKHYEAGVKSSSSAKAERSRKDSAVSSVVRTQAECKQTWSAVSRSAADVARFDTLSLAVLPTSLDGNTHLLSSHSCSANPTKNSIAFHKRDSPSSPFSTCVLLEHASPCVSIQPISGTRSVVLAFSSGEISASTLIDSAFDSTKLVSSLSHAISACKVSRGSSPKLAIAGAQGCLASVVDVSTGTPTWKAKSLGNDSLNMTIPIWDKDICWVHDSESLLAVATAFGQIRLYDTRNSQRKPVVNYELQEVLAKDESVGKNQRLTRRDNLFSLTRVASNRWQSGEGHGFVVGSNRGHAYVLDVRQGSVNPGRVCFRLKGFQGAVRDIQISDAAPVLAACGLDRHVRLFDVATCNPVGTIYAKLPLSCLAFVDGGEVTPPSESCGDSSDEEWEQLAAVTERKPKRSATSTLPEAKRRKQE